MKNTDCLFSDFLRKETNKMKGNTVMTDFFKKIEEKKDKYEWKSGGIK